MFFTPKFILILLVLFGVWYAIRWVNGPASKLGRRRPPPPPRQAAIEDLVACRTCGAYVATSARSCGKPGCPQPR